MSNGDFFLALLMACLLSLGIAALEVVRKSKAEWRACLVFQSAVYCGILCFGNIITTLLATVAVKELPLALAPFHVVFAPFFGVFGFEVILKNTNVMMFDRGVLTIQTWIQAALDGAAGAAIDRQEDLKRGRQDQAIKKLMSLSEEDVNARVLAKLGPEAVTTSDAAAAASKANAKLYKVLQLVSQLDRGELQTLLRG